MNLRERLLAASYPLLYELNMYRPLVVLDTNVLKSVAEGVVEHVESAHDFIRNRAGVIVRIYVNDNIVDYFLSRERAEDNAVQVIAYCMLHPARCVVPRPVVDELEKLKDNYPEIALLLNAIHGNVKPDLKRYFNWMVIPPSQREQRLAQVLQRKYPSLSPTDAIVLAMAITRNGVVATGDLALAQAARSEGIPYVYTYSPLEYVAVPKLRA